MFCEDANYVLFRFPCGCRGFRWSLIPARNKTHYVSGPPSQLDPLNALQTAKRLLSGFCGATQERSGELAGFSCVFVGTGQGVRPSRDRGSVGGFTAFRNTISCFFGSKLLFLRINIRGTRFCKR